VKSVDTDNILAKEHPPLSPISADSNRHKEAQETQKGQGKPQRRQEGGGMGRGKKNEKMDGQLDPVLSHMIRPKALSQQ